MTHTDKTRRTFTDPIPDRNWMRRFRARLRRWYSHHARDLPWRATNSAYHVWVSEIMLQQTQVSTVCDYFPRFIRRFPTVTALAAADTRDVLQCWEGLGYYRRALQLHKAARHIVANDDGEFPREISRVLELPGIGRYTAGAILSIAFDQRQPILEANTTRLYCRLLGHDGVPSSTSSQHLLWAFAQAILPRVRVGDFNQALMELGGTVCLPRKPSCATCPLASLCPTVANSWQDRIPRHQRRAATTAVREAAVVIRRRDRFLMRQYDASERWSGLWDFPRLTIDGITNDKLKEYLHGHIRELIGLRVAPLKSLTTLKHSVTRYRITLECFNTCCHRGRVRDSRWRWITRGQLPALPQSVTARKISRLLE